MHPKHTEADRIFVSYWISINNGSVSAVLEVYIQGPWYQYVLRQHLCVCSQRGNWTHRFHTTSGSRRFPKRVQIENNYLFPGSGQTIPLLWLKRNRIVCQCKHAGIEVGNDLPWICNFYDCAKLVSNSCVGNEADLLMITICISNNTSSFIVSGYYCGNICELFHFLSCCPNKTIDAKPNSTKAQLKFPFA